MFGLKPVVTQVGLVQKSSKGLHKDKILQNLLLVTAIWAAMSFGLAKAQVTYTDGENDATDYTLGADDSFETVAGGGITATQSGTVDISTFTGTFDAMDATDTLTFSGAVSGSGTINVNGAGIIEFNADNSGFTGTLNLNGAGTLRTGNSNALGSALVNFNVDTTIIVAPGVDFNGGLSVAAGVNGTISNLTLFSGFNVDGSVNLGNGSILTLASVDQTSIVINGLISGSGMLEVNSPDQVFINNGGNNFTGGFLLTNGGVILGSNSALGTGTVTFNDGILTLDSNSTFSNNIVVNNVNTKRINLDTGTIVSGGINLNNGSLTFSSAFGVGIISGDISGNGDLTLGFSILNSEFDLTGSNVFTGGLTLTDDTILNAIGGSALSANALISFGANSVLNLMGNETAGGLSSVAGNGTINLGTNSLTVNEGGANSFSGVISGAGGLVKNGAGTLTLTNSSTFTGGVTVENGTLVLGNADTLDNNAGLNGLGTVIVNGGILDLDTTDETIGSLSGTGGTIALSANTLTLNQSEIGTFAGVISGAGGGLVKNGAGTLTLSGVNTFDNGATINAGILSVTGSLASAITVEASGTLGGTGTVNSITANGTVAPGTSIGTLFVNNNVVFNSTSVFEVELTDTPTNDLLNVTGTVTIVSGATVSGMFSAGTYNFGDTFTIIQSGGGITGNFDSFLSNLPAVVFVTDINGNNVELRIIDPILVLPTTVLDEATFNTAIGEANAAVLNDVMVFQTGVTFGLTADASAINLGNGLFTRLFGDGSTINGNGFLALDVDSGQVLVNNLTINNGGVSLNSATASLVLETDFTSGTLNGAAASAIDLTGNVYTVGQAADGTFAGVISGAGSLVVSGAGKLTLAEANTFTGGLDLADGMVVLTNDSGAGPGNITLSGTGLSSLYLGSDGLNVANDIVLTADGEVGVGASVSATASGNIDLMGNTLTLDTDLVSDTLILSGTISGAGGLFKTGAGLVIVSGNNTFTGSSTIDGGTLQLLDSNALGGGDLAVLGSTVELGDTVNNAGAVNLSADATLKTLDGGTETVEQSGNVDTSANAAANTLMVNAVDAGDALTVSGAITGTGSIANTGAGTVTLSGANTFTGGTTHSAGTLILQNGSTLADAGALAVNGGTLQLDADEAVGALSGAGGNISLQANSITINQSANGTFGGVISGTGGLTKNGASSLTLTGTNTYTGDTDINGGALFNNGSLAGNVNVNNGGLFGGAGTVLGNLTLNSGGTLATGNSIGTQNVANATFNPGSSLTVEVDPAGNADLLNASGVVTINGGDVSIVPLAGTYAFQTQYTIIAAAGGVTGVFDSVSVSSLFTTSLQYLTNAVQLTLQLNSVSPFAVTPNQTSIGGLIDNILQGGSPPADLINVVTQLLSSQGTIPQNLDQLSGQGLATLTSSTLATTNLRIQGVASHLNQARACHNAYGDTDYRDACDISGVASNATAVRVAQDGGAGPAQSAEWGNGVVWFQGYGGKANMDAGGGKFEILGFDLGYDRWVSDSILVGVSLGYSKDQQTAFSSLTSGKGKYLQVSAHTAISFAGGAYFNSIVNVGFGSFDTTRSMAFGTFAATASGSFDGKTLSVYSEIGYDGRSGSVNIQPFGSLQYTNISRDAYTETGAGTFNLIVGKQKVSSVLGTIGTRVSTLWKTEGGLTVKPEVRARFVHEFGNADTSRAALVNLAGSTAPFATINDATGYSNAVVVGVGFDFSTGGNMHFVLDFDYLLSNEYDMWSGTGRFLWNF